MLILIAQFGVKGVRHKGATVQRRKGSKADGLLGFKP
jgi:hypothetical protein